MTMPTGRNWLRLDALNRSWRTTLQGIFLLIALPVLDLGYQLVTEYLMAGDPIDWKVVGNRMVIEAVTVGGYIIVSYLHRMKVDPSSIPSAIPPATPPGAPATDHRPTP